MLLRTRKTGREYTKNNLSEGMKSFWNKLNRPIYALAPMAGVTDSAFRQMCRQFGADVVYSEMASVNALVFNPAKTLAMLEFSKIERPYVVQLFGSNPEHFAQAVKIIEKKIKPDGIDINFGCPVKKVQKQNAGAVLMNDLELSRKIIEATIAATSLPVSIKVRSRVGNVDVLQFLKYMKGLHIETVMIHGRALSQGHTGSVDHLIIKKARPIFSGLILANGGAKDYETAQRLLKETQADGIGIGQGALGRPWIFQQVKNKNYELENDNIQKIALTHSELAHKLKGKQGILEMRKHLCWYVQGQPGAKEMRSRFVKANTLAEIKKAF